MSDVSYITCAKAGCGYSPFPMDAQFEQRARRTHERFYCPAGHPLSFRGKTEEQKRIDYLERRVEWWKEYCDSIRDDRDRFRFTCQWVGCGFRAKDDAGLHTHMRARHDMPTLAEIREAS